MAGELAQRVRALAALPEDLCSTPSNIAGDSQLSLTLKFWVLGSDVLFYPPWTPMQCGIYSHILFKNNNI